MLRIINAEQVRELLPMERCIELMRHAMALVPQERTLQPIRSSFYHPNGKGLLSLMPGQTAGPDWFGLKVVTVYPGNFGTAHGSHQGVVLLFDAENGAPVTMMEGRQITATRTAAATAVATDVLARADASVLAIFGYGEEAHTHLEALRHVRDFERILIWGRDWEKAQAFSAEQTERLGRAITPVRDAEEAATAADIVVTATAASEPFYRTEWLRPGQHINAVGSSIATTSEIDPEIVARARLFVDFRDSALALAGDFLRAKQAGLVDDAHMLGTIGDVLLGNIPGRTGERDITLFKSLGMICEDIVSADHILREAEARDIGTKVEWA